MRNAGIQHRTINILHVGIKWRCSMGHGGEIVYEVSRLWNAGDTDASRSQERENTWIHLKLLQGFSFEPNRSPKSQKGDAIVEGTGNCALRSLTRPEYLRSPTAVQSESEHIPFLSHNVTSNQKSLGRRNALELSVRIQKIEAVARTEDLRSR